MSWVAIARLGCVQAAIGSIVMLCTSLLNRVMVVEYSMAAAVPAGLVAWHYAVQLSRPAWGHRSDSGGARTRWVIGGMGLLATGAILAVQGVVHVSLPLAILAFTMIGGGVGAAGTSLLALLATQTPPERRAAAAAVTWIMMIVGIIVTASVAGRFLEPFSPERLQLVSASVALAAFVVAALAVLGVEQSTPVQRDRRSLGFRAAVVETLGDREARVFTIFVFVSMLAYSMQDMILEPFAGLIFAMTPGETTQMSGVQHMGVLAGMIVVGVGGRAFGARNVGGLRSWTVAGCMGSAIALVGLAASASSGGTWPLLANVAALGFCNGVFAVSAIASMMALAGAGGDAREGVRMGIWGAAQAIAFGLGGLLGAIGVDAGRAAMASDGPAFALIFALESGLFLFAAAIAMRAVAGRRSIQTRAMAGAL